MRGKHTHYRLFSLLLITAALFYLSSCSEPVGESTGFGNPPSPENCFCDPEGVETYLEWIAESYPDLTRLRSIGISESGRDIYAIELSDNPGTAEDEPKVLINGSIHGNEQIAAGIPMKLIEYLLTGYSGGDPEVRYLLNSFKLHLIPALNPDGLASGIRYNSSFVDLNRNFGYNWEADTAFNGSSAFDQAESAAVREDFLLNGYCLSLNLHTASSQTNIGIYSPWDAVPTNGEEAAFTADYLPNYPFIKNIGEAYASTLRTSGSFPFSQYFHFQEGADWYPLCGSMTDWALGINATLSYTIELYGQQSFTVNDSAILQASWIAHKDALLNLIRTAELGSGGRIIDQNGQPVAGADISLADDSLESRAFIPEPYPQLKSASDSEGLFRLLTGAGSYSITIEKTGYQRLTAEIVLDGTGKTGVNGENLQFCPEYILVE